MAVVTRSPLASCTPGECESDCALRAIAINPPAPGGAHKHPQQPQLTRPLSRPYRGHRRRVCDSRPPRAEQMSPSWLPSPGRRLCRVWSARARVIVPPSRSPKRRSRRVPPRPQPPKPPRPSSRPHHCRHRRVSRPTEGEGQSRLRRSSHGRRPRRVHPPSARVTAPRARSVASGTSCAVPAAAASATAPVVTSASPLPLSWLSPGWSRGAAPVETAASRPSSAP